MSPSRAVEAIVGTVVGGDPESRAGMRIERDGAETHDLRGACFVGDGWQDALRGAASGRDRGDDRRAVPTSRIRLGQSLLPFAVLATVGARYMLGPVTVALAVGLQMAALASFVLARKSFGHQSVHIAGGKIQIGDAAPPIVPSHVTNWTLVGPRARLYGRDVSWKLQAKPSDAETLRHTLSRVLGKPLALRSRGSHRARAIAVAVGLVGVALTALAAVYEIIPLLFVGIPAALGGWAAFSAFKQKLSIATPSK